MAWWSQTPVRPMKIERKAHAAEGAPAPMPTKSAQAAANDQTRLRQHAR